MPARPPGHLPDGIRPGAPAALIVPAYAGDARVARPVAAVTVAAEAMVPVLHRCKAKFLLCAEVDARLRAGLKRMRPGQVALPAIRETA